MRLIRIFRQEQINHENLRLLKFKDDPNFTVMLELGCQAEKQ